MSRSLDFYSRTARATILAALVASAASTIGTATNAQEPGLWPEMDPGYADSYPPVTEYGGGDFFSQELGTLLRVRYNTESYGQSGGGNLDLGTMKVFNFHDAVSFFDGQVTLNDENGVGFNAGVGFRWLSWTPFPLEPERVNGFSLWADGTHTSSGGFFPQVGLTWESLGDMWDFRANSYIPVGDRTHTGEFEPTGNISFQDNFLSDVTLAEQFTSYSAGELEFARRLGAERDAWLFAGPYALANSDEDTAGWRAGVRGYAYPDLMVQVAVSDDDIFQTNAAFSIVWFVGRTRTNFQPACGLPDRLREPVMRNDYVVLSKEIVTGGINLTDTNGDAFRFVHVDSDAPGGGDGTFENPLNNVANVEGNSMDGDIVLLYSDSVFSLQNTLVLQDNQRLLGEGDDMIFQITTSELGVIDIPETSPGSREGAKPIIQDSIGAAAITLADANEVANLAIDGGMDGIVAGPDGAGNPNLHDLMLMNLSGNGIVTSPFVRVDDDDPDLMTVAGNVTINNVTFDDVGGVEIDINSMTAENVTDPDVTLQEAISIMNVESTNGGGQGIRVQNTHDGGTVAITNYENGSTTMSGGGDATEGVLRFFNLAGDMTLTNIDVRDHIGFAFDFEDVASTTSVTITGGSSVNGLANDAGGMQFMNYDGTLTVNNTTIDNGTRQGVLITGGAGDSDGTFNFAATFDIENPDATAFEVESFTGALTMSGDITHDGVDGSAVIIRDISDATTTLTFLGDISHIMSTGDGLLVEQNAAGTILFSNVTIETANFDGVTLDTNGDTDISFGGPLMITTTGTGQGFTAIGGGTLTAANTNNSISSAGATGLQIEGMEITTAGVNFPMLSVDSATSGVLLRNNTGGPILVGTVGQTAGMSGTITNVTEDAVVIENSANVTVSGLVIDSAAGFTGVRVQKTTTGMQTINLNDLEINDGDIGLEVIGGGAAAGDLVMTVNDTDINSSTDAGLSIDNVDNGTINVNNVTLDGNNAGAMATGVRITNSDAMITFDADTTISEFSGTDFEVDGGAGAISMAGDIDNTDAAGRSIHIHDVTGGTVNMTGEVNDSNLGVLVEMNTGGAINLLGDYTLNTGTSNAVEILSNTGADVGIGDFEIMTTSGSGFVATGGGDLTVNGNANTIVTTGGRGIHVDGMNIVGSANFESVAVNGGDTGILLNNVTGAALTVGDTGNAAGEGGTIQNTTDDGIVLTNVASVVLNGVTVENAGDMAGENALAINKTTNANMTVTLNELTVDTTHDGVSVNGTAAAGTFNVNSTGGTVTAAETALEAQGRVTAANFSQDITNTTGLSIHVHDVTAGTVTHTGSVTDTGGEGVLVENNTGGSTNLLGDYTLNTADNDAVTITNNTGASIDITGLDVDTTSGNGFVATGGGTLTVTGTTNTINTTTGVGLRIEDMTIGAAGANYQSVTVNGATTGIVLENVSGGQVAVGNTAGALNSGGTLNTTNDAISLTDVENVDLRHIQIVDAGGNGITVMHTNAQARDMDVTINDLNLDDASGNGVDVMADNDTNTFSLQFTNNNDLERNVVVDVTGGGQFNMLVENTNIGIANGTANIAFDLQFHDGATDGDVTMRNNTFTADTGRALFVDSFGNTAKDIKFLLENSSMLTVGADPAADIQSRGNTLFQATIQGNSFDAVAAANDMQVLSNGTATARMRLSLGGDDPADFNSALGAGSMLVSENGTSVFSIFERDATITADTRNADPVDTFPNDAAFQNLATPPALPEFP